MLFSTVFLRVALNQSKPEEPSNEQVLSTVSFTLGAMILPKSPMAMAVFVLIRVVQVGVECPRKGPREGKFIYPAIWLSACLDECIGLIWSDRVNSAKSVGLFLSLLLFISEDRASSSLGRCERRLISLIFAGRNRIIMIRRELPLTVIANPAEPVA
jgi:hypothetical protein